MMKIIFLLILGSLFYISSQAQISKVSIQASGLTCSMCSNSINKSLKSVEFVDNVISNIKNSSFEITFKPGARIDYDQLKKKVEDAGFFVAKFEVTMNVTSIPCSDDAHLEIDGSLYHFLNVGNRTLNGIVVLQLLDKGFVTDKEFRRNARYTSMGCYKTGYMGSCCKDKTSSGLNRIFHVTI